jgi:hypothetical protein
VQIDLNTMMVSFVIKDIFYVIQSLVKHIFHRYCYPPYVIFWVHVHVFMILMKVSHICALVRATKQLMN